MTELQFAVVDARAEPYAAVPTITLRLRITDGAARNIDAIALRCQVNIEPQRRRYTGDEEERLVELFGEAPRWGDTLRPFLWTNVTTTVPRFRGTVDVELPIACTYDMEVAAAKYLHGLDDGEIPLALMFSGTVFTAGEGGLTATPVAWHADTSYRLPVITWRQVMDLYFPGSGWLRLPRETIDALQRFKAARALPTWEQAIETLLKEVDGP
ncbi:MAG: hypothetical protein JO367_10840 [Actinobacteria bacterium]|nr:hypothetical protein [Actinomycetota bacterium]